jgi:hypothetical protein
VLKRVQLRQRNRLPTDAGVEARNLVAAVFALQQSQTPEAQLHLLSCLSEWLHDRPGIDQDIATWYVEAIAPFPLPVPADKYTISLAEVEAMGRAEVLRNYNRDVERQAAREVERQLAARTAESHAKGKAEGNAEGKAEGRVEQILSLVRSGDLSMESARAAVQTMLEEKTISAALARSCLDHLG